MTASSYRVSRGIYYFPTYEDARSHAQRHGLPTDRLIRYGLGWAIQLRVSGPYAGDGARGA
jgi:hypothetical protein